MLNTLLLAFALAFILEGIFPALFPNKWKNYVQMIAKEDPSTIRTMGTVIILFGCLLLWFFIYFNWY